MGLERTCYALIAGRRLKGVAHLEPGELRFVAARPLRIPLDAAARVVANDGGLDVEWPGGSARFELGPDAETWALRIRYPRGRLDKLGIRPESMVSVVGLSDAAFDAELAARTPRVSHGRVRRDSQIVVAGVTTLADLDRLSGYRAAIAEDGAIWVVWTKGRKALTETHVREAAKAQGLVDVKVMSFSEQLSALKLVIPKALRTGSAKSPRARKARP